MRYFVYIMSNKARGTLYIGATGNLPRRLDEHKQGLLEGFTKRYGLKNLVYYEEMGCFHSALQRERNLKHWSRTWKIQLIEKLNPQWRDLYEDL